MRIILQLIFIILKFLLEIEDFTRKIINHFKKLLSSFPSFKLTRPKSRKIRKIKPKIIYHRKRRFRKLLTKLKYLIIGILVSLIFFFLPAVILIFLQDLPSPSELTFRQIPQTTRIFDRNGILLAQIYAGENRTLIPLSNIPKYLQEATISIEDKNFYNHPGFDLPSIVRAIKVNTSGKAIQGGSTITQQLIKSSILTPEQSVTRKIKELILAFWAERIYTKNQILEMYFNQVPYGGTAWGVEAASLTYFDKSAKDLDLAESAFLAVLGAHRGRVPRQVHPLAGAPLPSLYIVTSAPRSTKCLP